MATFSGACNGGPFHGQKFLHHTYTFDVAIFDAADARINAGPVHTPELVEVAGVATNENGVEFTEVKKIEREVNVAFGAYRFNANTKQWDWEAPR